MNSIVGWLVYSPLCDANEYYLVRDREEALEMQRNFDLLYPKEEHKICALRCTEYPTPAFGV